MKRLLCAGAPDIYQVCRVFRAGERGATAQPRVHDDRVVPARHRPPRADARRRALLRRAAGAASRSVGDRREHVTYATHSSGARRRSAARAASTAIDAAHRARRRASVPDSMRASRRATTLLDLAMGTRRRATRSRRIGSRSCYDFPASQAALAQVRGAGRVALRGVLGTARTRQRLSRTRRCRRSRRARFEADLRATRRASGQPVRDADRDVPRCARRRPAALRRRRARLRPPRDGRRRRAAASTR